MAQRNISEAYTALRGVIQQNYKGDLLNFNESLGRTIRQMECDLADIEQGEFNGTPIRDPARIPDYLETAVKPVIEASASVMNCVGTTGWAHLDIPYEERERLGGTISVDLPETEEKLTGAINHWLTFLARHPEYRPALPLHANSPARESPGEGISRLSEVTTLTTRGYEALPFRTNEFIASAREAAQQDRQIQAAPTLTGMKA